MKYQPQRRSSSPAPSRQRGVVLLFSLIALVVLLIAAVALMRSFNTSLFSAGNIAFKRDLQNQGERAVQQVLTEFRTGALTTPGARSGNVLAKNYSALQLPVNAQGIPKALATDSAFALVGDPNNDISPSGQAVQIRYVVDRMCSSAGDEKALGTTSCVTSNAPVPSGTSAANMQGVERSLSAASSAGGAPQVLGVVYRVSIRVNGPRNTQAFFQSTFTLPST